MVHEQFINWIIAMLGVCKRGFRCLQEGHRGKPNAINFLGDRLLKSTFTAGYSSSFIVTRMVFGFVFSSWIMIQWKNPCFFFHMFKQFPNGKLPDVTSQQRLGCDHQVLRLSLSMVMGRSFVIPGFRLKKNMSPLVNCNKITKNYRNHHVQWKHPLLMAIFHSYDKSPEGTTSTNGS